MPLPRGSGVSEMPQRLCRHSTHSRNASSESGGVQPLSRHSVGSPKFSDRRVLKGSIPEKRTGVNHELQKKRGTRISDLESQLGQVHDEVKKLKEQLASVQNAKKEAELELEGNKKQVFADQTAVPDDAGEPKDPADVFPEPPETPEKEQPCLTKQEDELSSEENLDLPDAVDNSTKVDELSKEETEKTSEASIKEADELPQEEGDNGAPVESTVNAEVAELKVKMQVKEQEVIRLSGENESLKFRLLEVEELKSKEEEMSKRLSQVTIDLDESNKKAARVAAQLEIVIQAKAELEEEMKRVRVQTEQWRKAAETAASVLAYVDNGAEMNRRSGSMNRQNKSGYLGLGSPLTDDTMEDTSAEKRKGSGAGIKKIGDLWKKKGQK